MERKIIDVFDNIHRLGVVHNDVRPENVLVAQPDGSVWVVGDKLAEGIFDAVHGKTQLPLGGLKFRFVGGSLHYVG